MTENNTNQTNWMDKFVEIASNFANITYIRVLKDSFTTMLPLFILSGFGVLFNSVIFPLIFEGDFLTEIQTFGTVINNGTLNMSGFIVAPLIAYFLSREYQFEDSIMAMVTAISSFIIMMPVTQSLVPVGAEEPEIISGVLTYTSLGANGIFAGIIISFISTEIFIRLSKMEALKIRLGEGVPTNVTKSFNSLIPFILTASILAIFSSFLAIAFDTDLISLITTLIQEPLRAVGTSLPGFLLLYTLGTVLFSFGIHHSVITSSVLQPLLLVNQSENALAASAGEEMPHIINESFRIVFGQIGGHGGTFALVLIILFLVKYEPYNNLGKIAIAPALFNINEPIIFGMPIVFNLPLMIPFILAPVVSTLIGYFAMWSGFIEPFSILVPWTIPPIIDGFLASGGDWKAGLVVAISMLAQFLLYLPFVRISIRTAQRQAQLED